MRLTPRQQHGLAKKFAGSTYLELVARWREAFDKFADNAGADDDAPAAEAAKPAERSPAFSVRRAAPFLIIEFDMP